MPAESSRVESPQHQQLKTIQDAIEMRKKDGMSEQEKAETKAELSKLIVDIRNASRDDAAELYEEIRKTGEELKNHTTEHTEIEKGLL